MPLGHAGEGWAVIDCVLVEDILESPFSHVTQIDDALHEAWAHATVDVLEAVRDASGPAEGNPALDRALKWLLVYHDVLLRNPPRGGRRGAEVIPARFDAWRQGDFEALVVHWLRDRAKAKICAGPLDNPRWARHTSSGGTVRRRPHRPGRCSPGRSQAD